MTRHTRSSARHHHPIRQRAFVTRQTHTLLASVGRLWAWWSQQWSRALTVALVVILALAYGLAGPLGGGAATSQAATTYRPMAAHPFSVAPKARGMPVHLSQTAPRYSAAQLHQLQANQARIHSLQAPTLGMSHQQAVSPASLNPPMAAPARLNATRPAVPTSSLADSDPVLEQANASNGSGGPANPCTGGDCSTVASPSLAGGGTYLMESYNYYDAVSLNGGYTWSYANPYIEFTGIAGVGSFAGNQQVLFEPSRNQFWWAQEYLASGSNPAGLGIATNSVNLLTSWCFYYLTAATFGYPTTDILDFPDLEYTTDNMFLSFNVYTSGGAWVASDVARLGLSGPSSCAGISGATVASSSNFQFALTQGAQGTMWFVSSSYTGSGTGSSLHLCQWQDPASGPGCVDRAIPAFKYAFGPKCGSADGVVTNWCTRVQSFARSVFFTKANFRGFGPATLGVALTVGAAGSDPYPWVAIYYFEVAGLVYTGEDALYNNNYAIAYPSFASNSRGWMGFSAAFGGGAAGTTDIYPSTLFGLYDPTNPTPPFAEWAFTGSGNATAWGDYTTTRPLYPSTLPFISAVWALDSAGNIYVGEVIYDRARDIGAYDWWNF